MDELVQLIEENENWLVDTIIEYAKTNGYAEYASTLKEAWRMAISDLSSSLIDYRKTVRNTPCLGPSDTFNSDILTDFGIAEAKRYRERGVSLPTFLGLMKYYKQSYIDLVRMKCQHIDASEAYRLFIERCFDRIEIAFCQEWTQNSQTVLISELQAINRLMTNEKNVYLTLFESQFDPTIILNKDNEIVNINHAAAKLIDPSNSPGEIYYQWSRSGRKVAESKTSRDVSGKVSDSIIGSRIDVYFPWLEHILKERLHDATDKISREVRLTESGQHAYYEITCSPILDISEHLRGTILTLRDITDRKNADMALKQSHEQLEKRVEERTADLKAINRRLTSEVEQRKRIETSLIKAKEEAEAAIRAKDDFLANMTHEVRTPLNGIFLLIDILQEAPLGKQQIKYLQMAKKSSRTLLALLNDLLNFSKIKKGLYETESIEFHLKSILKSAISDQLPIIMEKGLDVTFQVQGSLPDLFRGDPGRLRQVLINLLNNAVKYTDKGSIIIRAFQKEAFEGPVIRRGSKNNMELTFSVADTGIGIPDSKLSKIFEMFTQVDESYCRLYSGAGLGLSICKGYVQMMGGAIWCESKLGTGSTFFFTINVDSLEPSLEILDFDSSPEKGRTSNPNRPASKYSKSEVREKRNGNPSHRSEAGEFDILTDRAPDDGMRNFMSKAPGEMEKLKDLLSSDNLKSIEKQTAKLRKYATSVGAEQLKKSLFRIELACRREDRHQISTLTGPMMDSFGHVMNSLKKFKRNHSITTESALCEF